MTKIYLRIWIVYPVSNELSLVIKEDLSTKSKDIGGIGDTGDKLGYITKYKEYVSDNKGNININNSCINCPKASDSRIEHNHPLLLHRTSKISGHLFGSN